MSDLKALSPENLYQHCDATLFSFSTTAELDPLDQFIGQERAMDAIHFGVAIEQDGYNIYALGPPGTGKHSVVRQILEKHATSATAPAAYVYVNNFEDPHKPLALKLPPGRAQEFRADMENLVDGLKTSIPSTFESDDYRSRAHKIEEEFKAAQEGALEDIRRRAAAKKIALIRTPSGFALAPVRDGEAMSAEEYQNLPDEERQQFEAVIAYLQEELEKSIHQIPHWRRQSKEKLRALNREFAARAVDHDIDILKKKYESFGNVQAYINAVREDLIVNVDDFINPEETTPDVINGLSVPRTSAFRRYMVNVMVDHSADSVSPVVYESHPTFQNLVGRVEHIALMGALITDFMLIKPGALHRANHGYLMLDAHKILQNPYAWEGLKRALRARAVHIESLEQMLSLASTVALEPEPIKLDIKVVLLGDRMLYYLLCQLDPDFPELFKVAADFDERLERSPENNFLYARLIATLSRKENLRPLDPAATARVIEYSARQIDDAKKLSMHMRSVMDLLRESDYWAGTADNRIVSVTDVNQAISAQVRRSDRLRDHALEAVKRNIVQLDVCGEQTGQLNGLSVIDLGTFRFGLPHKISASVRLGEGELIDIEREVELGGPIHSKGILILAGFLGERYAKDKPLSMAASLVFEQSYAEVEGDSASAAELLALLSAISGIAVKQSLAITGSVSQHGVIRAIGGVNEKIEGFFDVCETQGFSGDQGVLIPQSNIQHLMLKKEVIEAVAAGSFHIYPISTIDEAIELFTGHRAGQRDEKGRFPEGTFNRLVEDSLRRLANIRHEFSDADRSPSKSSSR